MTLPTSGSNVSKNHDCTNFKAAWQLGLIGNDDQGRPAIIVPMHIEYELTTERDFLVPEHKFTITNCPWCGEAL